MKRIFLLASFAAVASAIAFGGTALAGDPRFATPVEAVLSGENGGDPGGGGKANMTLYPVKDKICYRINVQDIDLPATRAHLHRGSTGETGDVVLNLRAPGADGTSPHECIRGLNTEFIRKIKRNPQDYYVNVHNEQYPSGAVRGQLSK